MDATDGGYAAADAASRPWRIGQALAQTLHFCRAHALILLAVQAPSALGAIAVIALLLRPFGAVTAAALAAYLIVALWSQAVVYRLALDFWSRRSTTLAAAVRSTAGRVWPYAWTALLVTLGALVGLLLLIVPGIVVLVRYGPLAGAVPIAESRSGWAALRRGRALLGGAEWRAAGTLMMLALIATLAAMAARVLAIIPVVGGPVSVLVSAALAALLFPAVAALQAWWYVLGSGAEPREASGEPLRVRRAVVAAAALATLALAVTDRRTVERALWSPSGSMLPTIVIGDHFFVDSAAYDVREPFTDAVVAVRAEPARGDVVVFRSPVDPATELVKRVIAVPGDRVEIRDKHVLVNGVEVAEPYAAFVDATVSASKRDQIPEITLGPGELFMLGDNRDRSYDSRFWGPARRADVRGKVTWVYWSRDPASGTIHWERLGRFVR